MSEQPPGPSQAEQLRFCLETLDLDAFRAALASLGPGDRVRLAGALTREPDDEPTRRNLTVGVPLVDRLRTPAALLRRQIRLEKQRILAREQAGE